MIPDRLEGLEDWTALKEWQIFCDFRDERVGPFPREHTSQAVRAAFVRIQSAGLLPATIPNTSVSTLFDIWCKLRAVWSHCVCNVGLRQRKARQRQTETSATGCLKCMQT